MATFAESTYGEVGAAVVKPDLKDRWLSRYSLTVAKGERQACT